MAFTRRQFLRRTLGSGIVLGLGGLPLIAKGFSDVAARTPRGGATPVGFPLRMPALFGGGTITAKSAQQEIWPGNPTEIWGYNGSFPGPTIRMQHGATLNVKLANEL